MLATPKDKRRLYLATSLCDGLEDNNIQQIIMLLMIKRADPNVLVPNYGITPFHLVIGNDSETFAESVTKLFLQHSGDPNVKSVDGLTPVHVAAAWGRSTVLQLLLANGGDPLCTDDDGRSPFHYAFDGKYYKAIATLSKYCSDSTNDDDKPKYNIKLEKVLVCNGNLLAEYETLVNSTCNKNVVSSTEADNCVHIGQKNKDIAKYLENVKKEDVQVRHFNQKYCSLNDSLAVREDQTPTAVGNANISNLPKNFKINSSPKKVIINETTEKEKNLLSEAINCISLPFASNCIINDRSNKLTHCDKSRLEYCSNILVSPSTKKNVKQEHRSPHLRKDGANENMDLNAASRKCCRNKFADNNNKTPSKLHFDSGQNSSSKKKRKVFKRVPVLPESTKRAQKKLNTRTGNTINSFAKTDQKSPLTPDIGKHDNFLQYQNIKVTAQSTPRKKSKYLHSRCRSRKHSKYIHTQTENIPKNYLLDGFGQDETKTTHSDLSIFNQSFNTSTNSDFHTSPDKGTFAKVTRDRSFKSYFPVNLNNGIYDEDEVCEDSITFANDHHSFGDSVHQGEKDQRNDCVSKNYALQTDTFGLCDNCKTFKWNDKTHTEQYDKSSPVHRSEWPCILSQEKDFIKNADNGFARNQWIYKCKNIDEETYAPEKEKDLSMYHLSFESNLGIKGTYNKDVQTVDVNKGQKCFSNAEDDLCSLSRMHISAESSTTNQTYASVQKEYIYEDPEEGVVFLERRYCTPTSVSEATKDDDYLSATSNDPTSPRTTSLISLSKELLTMDNQTLREKLKQMGDIPGPITATTKQLYLKRLINLESKLNVHASEKLTANMRTKNDRLNTDPWLQFGDWLNNLSIYAKLEKDTFQEFVNPDPSRRWREGTSKTCFNYLLLDSRVTQNLPNRNNLTDHDTWAIFLSAIFYVGKGKRSRPYSHLYDAFNAWILKESNVTSRKIKRILDIWNDGHGVVCLHIFQNTIPVEAYTREAAMIETLGLSNLDNCKGGDYYGIMATWSVKKKQTFGRYLLYRAMQIFMYEGERQLFPEHL